MTESSVSIHEVRVRPAFETPILLACVASTLLPTVAGLIALTCLILLWLAARPPRQERVFVGVGLTLAACLILASLLARQLREPSIEDWSREVDNGFADLWDGLRIEARRAAAGFEEPPARREARPEYFRVLEGQLRAESDVTFLLLAPDGDAVAWAGEGLFHEGDLRSLPSSGFAFRRGYATSTIFAVEPLSDDRRPWRLAVGRSVSADRLPFETAATPNPESLRWLVASPEAAAPVAGLRVQRGENPVVFVERPLGLERRPRQLASKAYRLGIGLLGLTLLALSLLRATGDRLLPGGSARRPPPGLPLLAVAGTAALGTAAEFQGPLTAALAVAVGLATWGLVRRRPRAMRVGAGALRGALTLAFLVLAAFLYQRWTGSQDLASSFAGTADSFALCLVWCLAALGLLTLAAPLSDLPGGDRFAWVATLLLLLGGASCDHPALAVPLLAVAGAAIVRWLAGIDFGRRPGALGGLLVLAALAGSVSWETAYRETLRRELDARYLPLVAPPTQDERNDIHQEIFEHFDGRDVAGLLAPAADEQQQSPDSRDLAYVLWRESPLAQRDALSALAVETRTGERSGFTFGLTLDADLELALPADRRNVPPVPQWNEEMIVGQAELRLGQRGWATVSYWLLPRPGFRLEVNEIGELDEALLRGGAHSRWVDGLPRGVLYGLYDSGGRAIASPWGEAPPLDPALVEPGSAVESVPTPAGSAWVFKRHAEDGIELLYLPRLTPRDGLERVGIHALGSLAWITGIALLALALALPRSALRELFETTIRSYSKRMILVYAALLLLPLIALNLVMMQSFADRERREQRAEARSALSSARLFLVDYLRGLEFGFDLETRVNRELMEFIASVVDHPVNFYWDSRLFTSSQPELFTAGLLPRRIPGVIFSRLALSGYEMGFRQRRGELDYLELYAPLDVGGASSRQQGLFLSVPFLEQEKEVARELAALRRRAVLATSALVMLLLAVGSRLARSFTKPLMEIIAGTRRIADGAPYLEVAPREHELEALADAIDDMARRIDDGRRRLTLEKQVSERIVESITSGVVSLDHDRRVLLQNQVAADRLGTEIGIEIETALEREPRLGPVLDFLRSSGGTGAQTTVELRLEEREVREWTLTWVPIPGAEDPAALLVVDDATEVLRGERLEAWAEMARIIAHEIKNPLTPIRLSADHMQQVYRTDRERFDEVFERCTANILAQVDELSDLASDFSIYSRIPRAEIAAGDLVGILAELVDGYHAAGESGPAIGFVCELEELRARFDPKLLRRAVRNVLENALRASEGRGKVELSIDASADTARIRVLDSGPGVDPELLRRIFEPYFSTYDSGTGLGLAITRRIVEEHGGSIEAVNRASGGLEVEITIPRADSAPEADTGPQP